MTKFNPHSLRRLCAVALAGLAAVAAATAADRSRPNIILIYADDLGYGDIGCNGATAVRTPNVDRLAREGLRFTSGYCTSATCTPSRYSMLTGEYAFRKPGTGVLPGDAAMIIAAGRATLPSLLRQAGYATAVVGKWHLGLGGGRNTLDWNREISPGPREIGFDYSFIMAATGDRVPCVYVENQWVVGLDPADPIRVDYREPFPGEPTARTNREALKQDWSHGHNFGVVNGIGRIGYFTGGKAALWKDEDMADTFTQKALAFIQRSKDQPFFLYFATHDIHVPRVPHPRFVGKTTMGPRGDAIVQLDWCVGVILRQLDELRLAENTLVLFTSDNGPVLDDGYKDGAGEKIGDHQPAGPFRGGKYSLYEGGTRVPFIVRWPARVKPGVTDALVSQVDLPASFAALVGQQPAMATMPDTQNVLPALLGESKAGRDHVLEHSGRLAIRVGQWKYVSPGPARDTLDAKLDKVTRFPQGALFNLVVDPGETNNLAGANPDKIKELAARLEQLRGGSAASTGGTGPTKQINP
jgi:arylsulfatase A-like enzyme